MCDILEDLGVSETVADIWRLGKHFPELLLPGKFPSFRTYLSYLLAGLDSTKFE